MRSKRKIVSLAVVSVCLSGFFSISPCLHAKDKTSPSADPLAGFKILNLPRGGISIGSRWSDGVGPLTSGLSEASLQTEPSLAVADITKNAEKNASIALSLATLLGFNGTAKKSAASKIHLEDLSIVRVADAKSLSTSPGAEYIWEGVKVNKFSIDNSITTGLNITAQIKKANPNISINAQANMSNGTTVSLSGGALYVAFRVVTFTTSAPKTAATAEANHSSSVSLGSNYRISIIGVQTFPASSLIRDGYIVGALAMSDGTEKKNGCAAVMDVANLGDLDNNGQPNTKRWGMACHNYGENLPDQGLYPLGTTFLPDGYSIDTLHVDKFDGKFKKDETGALSFELEKARFSLESRTVQLQASPNPTAAGW